MGLRHSPYLIIVLLLLVVLLFGSKRLPDLARSVGQSLKILKKDVGDLRSDGSAGGTQAGAGTPEPPAGSQAPTGTDGPATGAGPAQAPGTGDDGAPRA